MEKHEIVDILIRKESSGTTCVLYDNGLFKCFGLLVEIDKEKYDDANLVNRTMMVEAIDMNAGNVGNRGSDSNNISGHDRTPFNSTISNDLYYGKNMIVWNKQIDLGYDFLCAILFNTDAVASGTQHRRYRILNQSREIIENDVKSKDLVMKCVGMNDYGQLGQGDKIARGVSLANVGDSLPNLKFGDYNNEELFVESFTVGLSFVCTSFTNGKMKCHGNHDFYGHHKIYGDDPNEMGNNLPFIDLGKDFIVDMLSSGSNHACVRDKRTMMMKCFGLNTVGQLGLGDTNYRGDQGAAEMGDNLPFVDVGNGRKITKIQASNSVTCALLDDNSMKCWGYELQTSQRNAGDEITDMGNNLPIVDHFVSSAWFYSGKVCYIQSCGRVKCASTYGYKKFDKSYYNVEVLIENKNSLVKKFKGNTLHSCLLYGNGGIKCFGDNTYGQLGYSDTQSYTIEKLNSLPFVPIESKFSNTIICPSKSPSIEENSYMFLIYGLPIILSLIIPILIGRDYPTRRIFVTISTFTLSLAGEILLVVGIYQDCQEDVILTALSLVFLLCLPCFLFVMLIIPLLRDSRYYSLNDFLVSWKLDKALCIPTIVKIIEVLLNLSIHFFFSLLYFLFLFPILPFFISLPIGLTKQGRKYIFKKLPPQKESRFEVEIVIVNACVISKVFGEIFPFFFLSLYLSFTGIVPPLLGFTIFPILDAVPLLLYFLSTCEDDRAMHWNRFALIEEFDFEDIPVAIISSPTPDISAAAIPVASAIRDNPILNTNLSV